MKNGMGSIALMLIIASTCRAQDLAQQRDLQHPVATWATADTRSPTQLRTAIDKAARAAVDAEAEGDVATQAQALVDLGAAQLAKGDLENAVRNSMRAAGLAKGPHGRIHRDAVLQLARIHVQAGHADRALELLGELGGIPEHEKAARSEFIRLEAEAKSRTLPPGALIEHLSGRIGEAVKGGNGALQAELLALMATAYTRQGGTMRAIELEEQVMRLSLANGNPVQAGISANNLAELLRSTPREAEATEMYQRAIILLEDAPTLRSNTMINLAVDRALGGDHSNAYATLDQVRQLARDVNDIGALLQAERTRAALQVHEGELDHAFTTANEALRLAHAANNDAEQMRACELLATIAELKGEPIVARSFEKRAHDHEVRVKERQEQIQRAHSADLARWQRMEREQIEQMNRQQRHQSEMRQLALDAENQEKRLALLLAEKQLEESGRREESMARERAQQILALTEAALATERDQRMIKDLENTRLLQAMSMDRLSMERKQRERDVESLEQRNEISEARSRTLEAERSSQRAMQYSSIAVAALMLVFGGYMTWAWYTARRKKRTIWRQKQQIEGINAQLAEKNQDIESSLRYAQTIQSAILPSEQDLRTVLPESFMLYKPLDKVSGDLPFLLRAGDHLYIAAIDCTGHGVPAGMMTFIAYYGLSDLIKQHPHAACGELLDRLHDHVKQTMNSRANGGLYNDGMDIGLCKLDLSTGTLNFSGAQLSLVLLREGQCNRLKGDVLPLGDDQFSRERGYQDHHMQLTPADRLFLFSDGIIHQFGGADGRKKFSMRRLNELLEQHAAVAVPELRGEAEKWLHEWKGDTPQTDDILVIGLSLAA